MSCCCECCGKKMEYGESHETESDCIKHLKGCLAVQDKRLDFLCQTLAKVFGWEDASYAHAVMHVENAVRNLQTDLAVAEFARREKNNG